MRCRSVLGREKQCPNVLSLFAQYLVAQQIVSELNAKVRSRVDVVRYSFHSHYPYPFVAEKALELLPLFPPAKFLGQKDLNVGMCLWPEIKMASISLAVFLTPECHLFGNNDTPPRNCFVLIVAIAIIDK